MSSWSYASGSHRPTAPVPMPRKILEISLAMVNAAARVPGATTGLAYQACERIIATLERHTLRQVWDNAFGDSPAMRHMRP